MKFFKIIGLSLAFLFFSNCGKDPEKKWNVEVKPLEKKMELVDISQKLYDDKVQLEVFKQEFPWFQGTVSDEDFVKRRKDPVERKIYQEAIAKIDLKKLNAELSDFFARVKHYFPNFVTPKVFLYSSALQGVIEPVFYKPEEAMLFVDVTGFMGAKSTHYQGLEQYYLKSMNNENILPKISQVVAQSLVPFDAGEHKFIDHIVYQGKIMSLQEAFLPQTSASLLMNYTPKEYDWCLANEVNIWNYFVEKDLLFSDDQKLVERFIAIGPFSKFYAEIDNESSPQVGIFTGWKITKAFWAKNPEMKMENFLTMKAQEIFNQSKYNPKHEE